MGRSTGLRLQDLRAIHRLVGECRELGDSATSWRSHLLDGVLKLTGSGVGAEYDLTSEPNRVDLYRSLAATDRGWSDGFDRAGWDALHAEFQTSGPSYQPMYKPYIEALRRGAGAALTRADLLSNDGWYRSLYYRDHHVSIGGDATLYCLAPAGRPAGYSFFVLVRAAGEPDFAPRSRTIVQELHAQVGPLIEGPLAGYQEPSPVDLTPRARQVLQCLLEGDGDKQVAARLGLSRHTVNFYVRGIFAHFRVATRSELMARWIRRGWALSSKPLDEPS